MAFVRETTIYGKSVARTFPTYHWVINHDIMSGFLSPGQEKNFSYVVMKPSSDDPIIIFLKSTLRIVHFI